MSGTERASQRPRRTAGGERRGEVLRQVIDVLAERGYDHTRFADVAGVAGLAVSTLQFYFGSRDDMLFEALHNWTEYEVSALEEISRPESSPWDNLVLLVDRALSPAQETADRVLMEFWHACLRDPRLREHGLALNERYRQPFRAVIRRGIDEGQFHPPHADTEDGIENLTSTVLGLLQGLVIPRALAYPEASVPALRTSVLATMASALGVKS
jgi:AcrR family transcriptional regulator